MRLAIRTLAAVAALVAACSAPPALPEPAMPFGHPADAQDVLRQSGEDTAPAAIGTSYAGFRVLTGKVAPKSAHKAQGSPLVICRERPIADRPHRIGWTVNPTAPQQSHRPAWLLVWFDEARPTDMTEFGYDGCLLWAPLDPKRIYTLTPRNGTVLTQDGGHVRLNWNPPASWAGRRVYCQLVVLSPGSNGQGWMLSPGLELLVGAR